MKSQIISLLALLVCMNANATQRRAFWASNSTSNFAYDASAPKNLSLLCSVHIANISPTTQKITNISVNNHTTQYQAANSDPAYYSLGTDLRGLAHVANKASAGDQSFNVGYIVVPLPSASGASLGAQPLIPTQDTLSRIPINSDLKTAGMPPIQLGPNKMLVVVARTNISSDSVAFSKAIAERKLYSMCSGFVEVQDAPVGTEPSAGLLMASGQSEYVADSPMAKTLFMEGNPNIQSQLDSSQTEVTGVAGASTYVSLSVGKEANSPFADSNNSYASCDVIPSLQVFGTAACTTIHKVNNIRYTARPQHIASVPITINGGKPF